MRGKLNRLYESGAYHDEYGAIVGWAWIEVTRREYAPHFAVSVHQNNRRTPKGSVTTFSADYRYMTIAEAMGKYHELRAAMHALFPDDV